MSDLSELKFGDKITFISPKNKELKTPCVFVKKENENECYVIFKHAIEVAKVKYKDLEKGWVCYVRFNDFYSQSYRLF